MQILINQIDLGILARISERDVTSWIAARLYQIAGRMPATTLNLGCAHYSHSLDSYHVDWTMLGGGEVVSMHDCVDSAAASLQSIIGDKAEIAKRKREQASKLLAEAQELEALK